jgi:hypothetical protein
MTGAQRDEFRAATRATTFFADEAQFYADADLRGEWVLEGELLLGRLPGGGGGRGDGVDGTGTAETSVAFGSCAPTSAGRQS